MFLSRLSWIYLLALLLTGIGYLAMTPPFEGFDEAAHYSSIQQLADLGTYPSLGAGMIDRAYLDYRGPASFGLTEPIDRADSFYKFFGHPELSSAYRRDYREKPAPFFTPGDVQNWQAQHPPLYYIVMAGLAHATSSLSFMTQFFWLRLASYLMALYGVAFGLLVPETQADRRAQLGYFLYPLLLPMFFGEFARLGNDSFCLFLTGVLALQLSKWQKREYDGDLALAIGLTLGVGFLVKGFFVAFAAAIGCFLALRLLRDAQQRKQMRCWASLAVMLGTAFLIGGDWYIGRFLLFHEPTGGFEAIMLAQQGGLIKGLQDHFAWQSFLPGLGSIFISYSWMTTRMLAQAPPLLHAPLIGLLAAVIFCYARTLKGVKITDFQFLPLWLLGFLLLGLLHHLLVGLALDGVSRTPGWYPHILMPFIAPLLGIGIAALMRDYAIRPFMIAGFIYAFLFQLAMIWVQTATFTGCVVKDAEKKYAFLAPDFCLSHAPILIERLGVVGWPLLALAGFGGGIGCAFYLWRQFTCKQAAQ